MQVSKGPKRFPVGLGIALILMAFVLVALAVIAVSPTTTPSFSKPTTVLSNENKEITTLDKAIATQDTSNPQPSKTQPLIQYALDLINKDRSANGLAVVTQGSNTAAQKHAEDMLNNSYFSHWGLDGMKPYMRYTLAGGLNYEAENAFMTAIRWYGGTDPSYVRDTKVMLDEAEESLMESPGHRVNILNKWHKNVNIGLAYGKDSLFLVQQFEGDYLSFSKVPVLKDGVFSVYGQTLGGFTVKQIQLWYDQLPHTLTLGQVGATHSYDAGTPAAFIRPPVPAGKYYTEIESLYPWESGVDPYTVSPDTAPPDMSKTQDAENPISHQEIVKWVDARQWNVSGSSFSIEANLSQILSKFGKGVYTVKIWGNSGTENISLSSYSIFHR